MTNQAFLRDLNLGIATGEYNITIDTSHLPNKWYYFWSKKRKIILDLFKSGAVLTGSRALSCYYVNGIKVFNRIPNDWDFLMTKEQFIKLCKDYNIHPGDLNRSQYHFNRSFATFNDGYGNDSYWFKCLIQIILKDDEPEYQEVDGIRFNTLNDIVSSKIELINTPRSEQSKHQSDITSLIINLS